MKILAVENIFLQSVFNTVIIKKILAYKHTEGRLKSSVLSLQNN